MTPEKTDQVMLPEPRATYRWVMLTLSWFLYFSFGLISTALSVLVTPVMNNLNLTYSQMGIILGSWQLVYIFYAQPAGLLIDRIGPYKGLLFGAVVISLSAAFRWFAVNFETLVVFVSIFGIGGPMISIGLPKLISMWFVGKERGTASGVYTTGNTVGSMVSLSITNSILMPIVSDWKKVFLIYSLFGLLIAILWLLIGRRSPPTLKPVSKLSKRENIGTMKSIFKNKNIWLAVIIGITYFLVSHGLSNWLPKILELRGMAAQEAGFVVSSLKLFGIFGVVVPRLIYILRSKKLAISITLLVLGISIIALGVYEGAIMWVALALAGITMKGLLPLLTVTLMDMPEVGPKRMGVVGGLYFSIGEIGGFGGPFIMGLLKDVTGSFMSGIIFIAAITEISILYAALLDVDT